jgi:hypothetical protein
MPSGSAARVKSYARVRVIPSVRTRPDRWRRGYGHARTSALPESARRAIASIRQRRACEYAQPHASGRRRAGRSLCHDCDHVVAVDNVAARGAKQLRRPVSHRASRPYEQDSIPEPRLPCKSPDPVARRRRQGRAGRRHVRRLHAARKGSFADRARTPLRRRKAERAAAAASDRRAGATRLRPCP